MSALTALTAREIRVLRWLADGVTVQQIATKLGIVDSAASMVIHRLKPKLGATTTTNAVYVACQRGLIPLGGDPRAEEFDPTPPPGFAVGAGPNRTYPTHGRSPQS